MSPLALHAGQRLPVRGALAAGAAQGGQAGQEMALRLPVLSQTGHPRLAALRPSRHPSRWTFGVWKHSSKELRPLSVNRTGAIKVKRLHPPIAEHFQDKAPRLFGGIHFQTKPDRLMVKFHGNRAETSDLIFMRKT